MSLFLFLVIIAVIAFALYDYTEKVRRLAGTPFKGPPFLPIVGHAYQLILRKPSFIFDAIQQGVKQFGPLSRVWLVNFLFLSITDPEYIEPILNSSTHIGKTVEYSYLKHWLGDGLLLTTGKKWHTRRKIITPAFHYKILESFTGIFDKQAKIFVQKLQHFSPATPVDVCPLVSLLTFDVICETAMGTSVQTQFNRNSEYVEGVKEITNILHVRMYNALLRLEFLFRLSKSGAREREIVRTLHKWTDRVIEKRREDLLQQKSAERMSEDAKVGLKDKLALLDVLLQTTIDGKALSNEDIREEVNTFMFAGHDTTTSGITFLLYNIALHSVVQEKILEEIERVIGKDVEKDLTIGDLKNLTYLECVIKESLRLFTPVPMIGRYFAKDTQLKDNLRIPGKSTVIIGAFCMGRDAKLFPDPETFKPERFHEDEVTGRNPFSYIPFSAGPRNCIGQKFAMLEMKTVIVRLLQMYKISVDPSYDKPHLVATIVLRSSNGIVLNFKKRT
ncbi:cytochrome P450 4d2-like [Phlebotomus argentipes]|uniref:cytochrome P450 4d2-like n=1 Tax=Phlebotomus argentipes TaxID=94469 RepID=UPI002893317D|nr:cytochrome P450 4d2-like [Phlebotomus argentipes]